MDDDIHFQARHLQAEIDFLKSRLGAVPDIVLSACIHARNFYWTATRLLGLQKDYTESALDALAQSQFDIPIPADLRTRAPRIFFDMTSTYVSRYRAGVQRVVRELFRTAADENLARPVCAENGVFLELPDREPIAFQPGDKIILLDSSWLELESIEAAASKAKAGGAEIVLGLYDMIPLLMPGFVPTKFGAAFEQWLTTILPMCAAVVAISKSSAIDLSKWVRATGLRVDAGARIGWFPLGSDFGFEASPAAAMAAAQIPGELAGRKYFLTVGTLEPRKGHGIALDAFDRLWAAGDDAVYVIAGREGWNVAALCARIRKHPQYGRRLFWIEGPSDIQLAAIYRSAHALVLPTVAEGFGLPLVEAAHHKVPAIVSDIPVFREIAGDEVVYFARGDSEALASALRQSSVRPSGAPQIADVTWRDSARKLFGMVGAGNYQARISDLQ